MRITRLLSALPMAVAVIAAGCARSDWFRTPGPRGRETIFSPLDLPAPNAVRTAAGAPGPEYWQQQVDYVIEASLDEGTRLVRGRATVTYHNNSPDPLDYLWLQLEQNIFRADSIGARVSARPGLNESHTDGCTIEHLRAGGEDLPFRVYDTQAIVELPRPIPPAGGALEFDIAWHFTIPERTFRRFGIEKVEDGIIFEVAQWFPAVAVYDDVHGWNTLPYVGSGEFYTNFGDYDVRLTVPRSHILVATGVLQNPADVLTREQIERLERARSSEETVLIRGEDEVNDPASRPAGEGPLTWHFKAEDVRTFAWASSPAFIYDAAGLDGILVQSVYPREALPLWRESTQMLRTAIEGYNERWYRYPYPVATNVNGIEGGMEYPMIIFCRNRTDERRLYGVTTHEIGHNWFPMLVSTDERRHAWMDEGFNTFINYYSFGEWFPSEFGRRGDAARFAPTMTAANLMPIETAPDKLPRRLVGELEYAKTAVGLVLLREQILGPERFDFAFRTYIRRWAFKSPRPADFFRSMEDAAGVDLAWFWRGWFLETGWLDQSVDGVRRPSKKSPRARVTFRNRGELVMPLVYRVTYADGSHEVRRLPVEAWHSTDEFTDSWETTKQVKEIVVDPDERFPDVERTNNRWPRRGIL